MSAVMKTEIRIAELLVPDPSYYEAQIVIASLKNYKLPGSDHIMVEPIQTWSETLHTKIYELINFVCNKDELPKQWKESIIVPIYKKVEKTTAVIIIGYHCYQLHTNFIKYPSLKVKPIYRKSLGNHNCGF
jgi:hypothetical protein